MKNTERWLLLVVIILMFQIIRNLNLVVYIVSLFSAYLGLYATYIYESIKYKKNIYIKLSPSKIIFLFLSTLIPFTSILYLSFDEYLIALPRFLVTYPFICFVLVYTNWNENLLNKVFKVYIYFIVLASLSIPYQIFFGKISFLAESSYREGLIRYASLAGSLTALGTLGGYALAILVFNPNIVSKFKNLLFQGIIVLGMGMSLQKAALINIIIVYFIYFLLKFKIKLLKIILFLIIISILFLFFSEYLKNNIIYIYINKIVNYAFNSESSIGTNQDLLDRIMKYPKEVVLYNKIGFKDLFLGIGFKALSGTMGLPKYPMAHNNYIDICLSSGIIYTFNYLLILINNFYKIKNLFMRVIIFLILINMLIGASTIYQPLSCIIIMCSFVNLKEIKNYRS